MTNSQTPRVLLTVGVVLLAVDIALRVVGGDASPPAAQAHIQPEPMQGALNAATQRADIKREIVSVNQKLSALQATLEGGKVRVQVEGLPDQD